MTLHTNEAFQAAIENYVPRRLDCAGDQWERIRPFVLDAAARLHSDSVASPKATLTRMTRFAAASAFPGTAPTIDTLLTHERIETYIAVRRHEIAKNGGRGATSFDSDASFLRTAGRRLNADGGFPVRGTHGRKRHLQPLLSAQTIEDLRAAVTAPLHRDVLVTERLLLALGHGVGATRAEVMDLRNGDIVGKGTKTYARLPQPDGHRVEVPMGAPYDEWLIAHVAGQDPDGLLIVDTNWRVKGHVIASRTLLRPPKVSLRRLRNTWTAERLAAGIPAPVVKEYGRYSSYTFLLTYAEYIPSDPHADYEELLATAGAP